MATYYRLAEYLSRTFTPRSPILHHLHRNKPVRRVKNKKEETEDEDMNGFHMCTSSCKLHELKKECELYVCVESGNLHVCGFLQCCYLLNGRESSVCKLTGRVFYCGSDFDYSTCTPTTAGFLMDTCAYSNHDSLSKSSSRLISSHGIRLTHKNVNYASICASLLQKVFPQFSYALSDDCWLVSTQKQAIGCLSTKICRCTNPDSDTALQLLRWIIRRCESLWYTSQQSPKYIELRTAINPKSHATTLLFFATSGLSWTIHGNQYEFIPAIAYFRNQMPSLDEWLSTSGVTCSGYNTTAMRIKMLLSSCPLPSLRPYIRTPSPLSV